MKFSQRLKFFGFGFVIGAIILIYILTQRKCRGMNQMKVDELASQQMRLSDKVKCKKNALGLNDTTFIYAFKHFRVNYAASDIHKKPCGIYRLETTQPDSTKFNVTVCDCDTISIIDDLDLLPSVKAICDSIK